MSNLKENNIIRQNIPVGSEDDLGHLPSGYGNDGGTPSTTFTIPSCGIEDCDTSIFKLFAETIKWTNRSIVGNNSNIAINKPQVIFATGERFAVAKRLRPPRDKNQVLMLPSISIRRTSIEQLSDDITGRGMNQFTGDLVIKTKLSDKDISFQNLLNKFAFQNMSNIPGSRRTQGNLQKPWAKKEGAFLDPDIGNNIFEIYTIPQPQFFTANYEVVFWTSYTQHMNYMIETLMSSFLPQERGFRLGTDKGYWFMAYVKDTFTSADNFEDFTEDKRVIRYNFTVSVKGYLLAPQGPANLVPVRKYISAPTVIFENYTSDSGDILRTRDLNVPVLDELNKDKFILSDLETIPESHPPQTSNQKFVVKKEIINPITNKKTIKYVKIQTSSNKRGENSYYASDFDTLGDFLIDEIK